MTKEMIVSSNGHETMVAILEDDLVAEIFVERERQRGVVGNVYKGRVSKVLPGMQSSFIDIGLERDGFLYVAEVIDTLEEFDKLESGDDEDKSGAARREEVRQQAKIEDLLKEGQEILVQVVKEPLGTKGARLTSHVTMPGRFLVFMPTVDHIGVSRKIESRDERSRLRGIVREFREAHGFTGGVIVRTAAGPRTTSSATSTRSMRSGPASARRWNRRGRRPSFIRSRVWSASCCAICSRKTSRRSRSTMRWSTSACWISCSGSCRRSLRG
jgi:ribonuclease G